MKLGTTILLCAASAIGTAYALDKLTDGEVRDSFSDLLIDHGLGMKDFDDKNFDDFEDPHESQEFFSACEWSDPTKRVRPLADLFDPETPSKIVMPLEDAENLYQMLEDAVGRLSGDHSDVEAFGDKAISFERLYNALDDAGAIPVMESDIEAASDEAKDSDI